MENDNPRLDLASIRLEYAQQQLTEEHVLQDARQQFHLWLKQALDSQVIEPTAMVLSSASADGQPSARVVLLKELDEGFVFFTNYHSRKGAEIAANPKAALTFFWPQLERQVRVEGIIEKVSEAESDTYFNSRPRGSQIGALVSPQSKTLASRNELEEALERTEKELQENAQIARPAHWGGYRLLPQAVEFWQGRPGRLHDRLLYQRQGNSWKISRLAP